MDARKKVLVAGASSGMGEATAIRFAAGGWDVCLNARRARELLAVEERLHPGDHIVCEGDASDPLVAAAIHDVAQARWGRLHAVVNSIGVWLTAEAIGTNLDEWRKPFDLMLNAAVNLTRAAVPLMSEGGSVIHITSIQGGDRAVFEATAYGMAKAAINQYCRALAIELAPRGILVNAIAPGFVDTPMNVINGERVLDSEWFRNEYLIGHRLPLRRAGRPEEIASVAWFLASPDCSYMTGQVLTVDGGLTLTF